MSRNNAIAFLGPEIIMNNRGSIGLHKDDYIGKPPETPLKEALNNQKVMLHDARLRRWGVRRSAPFYGLDICIFIYDLTRQFSEQQ